MKKIILTAVLAATLVAPAAFAGDKLDIEFNGSKERIDVDDVKTASVCTVKQRAAAMFGLKMKKFDLQRNRATLNEDKTLYAAGVRAYNKLTVKEVNYSSQC